MTQPRESIAETSRPRNRFWREAGGLVGLDELATMNPVVGGCYDKYGDNLPRGEISLNIYCYQNFSFSSKSVPKHPKMVVS